jgi:hypothetical protein
MTLKMILILVGIFIVLIIVLSKLTYVKPKYRTRPGGIHYKHRPGGIHYITREEYIKNKHKNN